MKKGYTNTIRRKIAQSTVGEAITAEHFPKIPKASTISILNRIAKKDSDIKRVKHGVFGKVKQTKYGIAKISPLELLVNEIKNDDNKCFGGIFLFNQLGLSTQVPAIIEILNNKSSYKIKIGNTVVHYSKIRPVIKKENKNYIIILEVIKKIKKIPNVDVKNVVLWVEKSLQKLNEEKISRLIATSMNFNPRTRAILGTFLTNKYPKLVIKLRASLNENSYYTVGILYDYLSKPSDWGLKQ